MFDSMLHMQMQEAATQLNRGQEVNWAAMPLSGVFPTSDGAVCFVGAFKQQPLRDLCQALELGDELWQRPELQDHDGQMANKHELQETFRATCATNTTAYWVKRLEEVDLLCAPVLTLLEAMEDPQTVINNMVVTMDHPIEGTREGAQRADRHVRDTGGGPAPGTHPRGTLHRGADRTRLRPGADRTAPSRKGDP